MKSRRRWWAAAALGIALMAVAWWNIGSPRSPTGDTMARLLVSLSPADGLAYGGTDLRIQGGSFPVAVSPDGTHIAYVGMVKDVEGSQLYIRDLAEEEGRLVRESDDATAPFFSPDGEWVGFFSGGFLRKVSVAGGVPITICEAPAPRGGSWNEDGQIVFAPISRAGLSIVSAEGGSPVPLTVLDDEYGETSHRIPEFLPGGDAVLFLAEGGTRQETRVVVHSLISGERRVLVEQATLPRFSPTGHLLFVQGGTSMAAPFDIERLEMSGRAVPVLPVTSTFYAMSGTGTLVYLADEVLEGMKRLVWVGRDGSEEPLAAPPRGYLHPRLSPRGARVAVDIEQEGDRNIWTYDFERETLERLTFDGSNLWPTWSPDGSTVAYASNRPGTGWDALSRRADGTGADEVLWSGELEQIPRSWSSDGETLAVSTIDPETRSDIWLISAREGAARAWRQTAAVEVEAAISPNGNWIAYTSNETGQAEIYVGPVSGSGKWQISTAGGREPVWAKDGTALFYWEGNVLNVARVSTGGTFVHETPTELLRGEYYRTSTGHAAYDVAEDGRFLMVRPEPVSLPRYLDVVLHWDRELERIVPAR